MGLRLYWIGLYEERRNSSWNWFFQLELAPPCGHFTNYLTTRGETLVLCWLCSVNESTHSHAGSVLPRSNACLSPTHRLHLPSCLHPILLLVWLPAWLLGCRPACCPSQIPGIG